MISQRPQLFDEPYIEFWLNICMKHRSEYNQVNQKGLAPGISQDLPKTWSCPEAKQDISWTGGKELQCNNLGSEENPAEIALESCISDRPEEVMCLSAAWSLSPEPLPCPSLSRGGKRELIFNVHKICDSMYSCPGPKFCEFYRQPCALEHWQK